jgi:hypothetical protein
MRKVFLETCNCFISKGEWVWYVSEVPALGHLSIAKTQAKAGDAATRTQRVSGVESKPRETATCVQANMVIQQHPNKYAICLADLQTGKEKSSCRAHGATFKSDSTIADQRMCSCCPYAEKENSSCSKPYLSRCRKGKVQRHEAVPITIWSLRKYTFNVYIRHNWQSNILCNYLIACLIY